MPTSWTSQSNNSTVPLLTKEKHSSKLLELTKKTQGKLVIKEYPTASAHVGHFKALLNELSMKKGFSPDIIFVDYLNICASARYKGTIVNSYTYVKAIAENSEDWQSNMIYQLSVLLKLLVLVSGLAM